MHAANNVSSERPNPDELLARVQREEGRARRGKLKIFFGYAAGVGKTYAMLEAAQREKRAGVDVVVGYVEPHGRPETTALLQGLDELPTRPVAYRGVTLREFDLDAALARRPELILVDELAHTNAEGSRHQKRWQDVQELLEAGIDVYSTLNVQHIESLNDVIAQITGVTVRETLPDSVIEQAGDLELIDITADELIERLEAGKVYVPAQAERAIRSFFQKSNLSALRELSLRQAASRIGREVETARRERALSGPGLLASGCWFAWARALRRPGCCARRNAWRRHSAVNGWRRAWSRWAAAAPRRCASESRGTCSSPSGWERSPSRWSAIASDRHWSGMLALATSRRSLSARRLSPGGGDCCVTR